MKKTNLPIFPFTAIVGQEEMKLALELNVIDPKIGGVMIMGDRGTGKSTTIRAIADLLPKIKVVKDDPFNSHPTDLELMSTDVLNQYRDNDSLETQPLSQISEESLSKEEEDENDLLDSNIEQPSIVSDESDENQTSANLFQETSDLVENDSLVVEEEGSIVEDDESAPISDLDDSESDNVDEVYSFDEDELDERD